MYSASRFGAGSGPVWLKNIKCNGNEQSVEDCPGIDWTPKDCSHSLDVGISCGFIHGFQGTV